MRAWGLVVLAVVAAGCGTAQAAHPMTLVVPTHAPTTPSEVAPPQPDYTPPPAPAVTPLGCPGGTVVLCYQWAQRQNQGVGAQRDAYCDRLATAIAGTSDYMRRLNIYNACIS